jgi:threonine dehydrogenase-like Zn-dependent dehydrogenase
MGFKGVLGHEFVGRVVNIHEDAAQEVRKELLDVIVCGDINLGCCKKINRLLAGYVTICWGMTGCTPTCHLITFNSSHIVWLLY